MPNYEYKCDTCESITIENFRISERPSMVECACGGKAEYTISSPMVMKEAYHDGIKRKGFADLKEASKLNKEAAVSSGSNRKEIQKEIAKMGVKINKEVI